MKKTIIITLLSIVALTAYATDSTANNNDPESDLKRFDDSDIHKCLNAFDEKIQSRIENELILVTEIRVLGETLDKVSVKTEKNRDLPEITLFAVNSISEQKPL